MKPTIFVILGVLMIHSGCSDSQLPRMSVDFAWPEEQKCFDERSPAIVLENVPAHTAEFDINMQDLDSRHDHGGGNYPYDGTNNIPEGVLKKYEGPCASYGSARYEITIKAIDEQGRVIAIGKKMKKMPPGSE